MANKAFKSDSQRLAVSLRSSIAKRCSHLNAALKVSMDKSEHCKEVYAYYGLAMYRAQCVEQSIIQLLIFCDLYEREAKSKHTQEEWEAKFDSFDQGS
ncbi:hypothetical protein OL319_004820 [Vibrio parahaemolyticus]|nr:hypothetical protein [Vibrio parahaemolyticus]